MENFKEDACDLVRRGYGILCVSMQERHDLLVWLLDNGFTLSTMAKEHIAKYEAGRYDDLDFPYIREIQEGDSEMIDASRHCIESVRFSDCYIGQDDKELTCDIDISGFLK